MAVALSRKSLWAIGVGVISLHPLVFLRDYPWPLALPVAFAAGSLLYSSWSAVARLRVLIRPRPAFKNSDQEEGPGEPEGSSARLKID